MLKIKMVIFIIIILQIILIIFGIYILEKGAVGMIRYNAYFIILLNTVFGVINIFNLLSKQGGGET